MILLGASQRMVGRNDVGHRAIPQSNRLARFFFIVSATYSAHAWMVLAGFTPPPVTNTLPSTMKRFFTSWLRPQRLTTERSGSLPARAVPSRCQPDTRSGPELVTSRAPAASVLS